ncbi:hypothetical protein GGR52DRAFT_587866 [Hypoxylon sp. FL1284]|nr:hypothetical protein GGR52DRAFT_587866 [Hypoxylon sp. FL1284]
MEHDTVVDIDLEKGEKHQEENHDQTPPPQDLDSFEDATSPSLSPEAFDAAFLEALPKALYDALVTALDKTSTMPAHTSCVVCRKTLLFSYFNCCGVCLGVLEYGRARRRVSPASVSSFLPTAEPARAPAPSLRRRTREPSGSSYTPSTTSSATAVEQGAGGDGNIDNNTTLKRTPHCDSAYCKYTHLRPVMALFVLCEVFQLGVSAAALAVALYCHDWRLLRFAGLVIIQWWQIFMLWRQWNCGHPIIVSQIAAAFFLVWYYVEVSRQWQWWEPLAIGTVLLKIIFPW